MRRRTGSTKKGPRGWRDRFKSIVRDTDWREVASLAGVVVVLGFLWHTPVVYPLKVLVTFLHELGHGGAAVVTGGIITGIEVNADASGWCRALGGNRFVIISSGYLGSMFYGGVILWVTSRTRGHKILAGILGGTLLILAILFIRPVIQFGFLFVIATGAALIAAGYYLPSMVNQYVLKTIGLFSCVYAVLDIKRVGIDQPGTFSDAHLLADHTGLPVVFWGVLWVLIAVMAATGFLILSCRKRTGESPTRGKKRSWRSLVNRFKRRATTRPRSR